MSRAKLIPTTRPLFWDPACKCKGAGYSLGATRQFRANGKACGFKGHNHAAPIVRVETVRGPSCDHCGVAWTDMTKSQGVK